MSTLLTLLACVPSADPLLHQREALDTLAPLAPDWVSQASLSLDPALVSGWIVDSVESDLQDLPTTLKVPGGVLGDLVLVQELQVAPVEVVVAGDQLHVATPVEGVVEVELQTLLGAAVEVLRWTGTVLCAFEIVLEGRQVLARPHEPERWGLDLVFGDHSDTLDAAIGILLEEALRMSLAVSPPEAWLLAELPEGAVRDLRLRAGEGAIIVDFAFPVPDPGQVGSLPLPGGGLLAIIPEQTALALLRSAVLQAPASPDVLEPTSLRLRGTTFELGVRHHVPRRLRPQRNYTVTGSLGLEDGVVVARPLAVRVPRGNLGVELGEDRRLKLLAELTEALTVSLPASTTAWVAGRNLPVEAVRLETRAGQLLIWGEIGEESDR